ncbi:uncharacterized protein LOC130299346 [Hyla sarda]|uniref:uncharacterized protein LOC130299346 n=1 Tax=Hyla sarda TaxID=327740 RepID=UPI0024C42B22|nr:uncharacterized protein LOC130299346 [Hyla sarda]
MSPDRTDVTTGLLHITLEIIRLLTGEDYTVVKKTSGESGGCDTDPPPHSIIHEKNNKKILELTNKMVELLTGEVPIRCQDVAVYFSMEEAEYVEGHKDQYKDIIMEDQPPLTSQDKGNLATKKRKRNPENDAKYHIITNTDKEGLTAKHINPYKGRGVFALTPMEKGDFVVEFRGELIDVAESQRRQRIYHEAQKVYMYEFQSGGKLWCIDAVREDASLGRLVNDEHRNPNCKIKRIMVDGRPHLCLFAIRDINPGEEITYNYGGSWPWRDKVAEEAAPAAVCCKEEKMDGSYRADLPQPTPNTERPPSTIHNTQVDKAAAPAAVCCKVEEVDVSYRADLPQPTPNTERPPSTIHNTQAQTDEEYLLATSEIFPNIIDSSDEDCASSQGETSSDESEEEGKPAKKDDAVLYELRARLRKIAQDSGELEVKCFQHDPEWPTLDDVPPSSNYNHPRIGNVSWCKCGHCRPMETRDESVCCREEEALGIYFNTGLGCITQHRELTEWRLQEKILEMNAVFSGKVKAKELITRRNQVIRKAGYRSFSVFAHGVLGPKHRKPIPSCVVNLIRSRYPDSERRRHWSEDCDASYMALEV